MDMFDVMLGSKLGGGGGGEAANYNDLTGLPQINGVELKGNKSTAQLLISFTASDVGALPDSTKYAAAVTLSIDQSTYVVTAQLKDQDGNNIGSASTVDLPLETMVVGGSYDAQNQKIVLTLKDGNTTDIAIGALISGLQPELVVGTNLDDTPTSGSTNPVTSDGVWTPLAYLVDSGAKNAANWSASTSTINNCLFTVSDDTITVTLTAGTKASARSQKALDLTDFDTRPAGKYIITGAPTMSGGGLYVWDNTANTRVSQSVRTTGDGVEFDFSPVSGHTYNITVDIPNAYEFSSLIFRPMICAKDAWDISRAYQPYAPTNAELYAMIQALQSGTRSVQMRTEPDESTGEEETR